MKCRKCGNAVGMHDMFCAHCGTATGKIAKKRVIICILSFIAMLVIGAVVFPENAQNATLLPSWYLIVIVFVPILLSVCYGRIRITKIVRKIFRSIKPAKEITGITMSVEDFKPPKSKKKQTQAAEELLCNIESCISLANKTTRVIFFVDWYDEALCDFAKLMKLEKASFSQHPALDYYRLKSEFQWHLCDAIVRAKENTLLEISGKYKNSQEFQFKAANDFSRDIDHIRDRFSPDTSNLADMAVKDVQRAAGVIFPKTEVPSAEQPAQHLGVDDELMNIDLMTGHEFEHWCAGLLLKTGFQTAEVTQASGDDGVDIIAEKDGVRYAIQCKCYSSDQGNKPVQEVHTGKSVYHCHVGAVMTNRHFTAGGKRAADATGTLLWDRDWIINALKTFDNK